MKLKCMRLEIKTSKILFALLYLVMMACESPPSYSEEVRENLASGERHDSLFLELKLRMKAKEFFSKCWELNKEGKIMQGPGNKSVEYKLEEPFRETVFMRFYPEFDSGIITAMPVDFIYEPWAPWNRQYSADSLLPEVLTMFENWYGGKFKKQEDDKTGRTAYFKIDGNRQILVFRKDTSRVSAIFTDIYLQNPLTK